ncbi:MAG: isoaspartyl peptidase/L-asparaginase [Bacteroidia bacterium]|nr:isoaspartyl peptidase/L-asparaginase [Bacteroidia bacterium]
MGIIKPKYAIALHGGAGTILRNKITPAEEANYMHTLADCLKVGQLLLAAGSDALSAVVATTIALENTPLFNAGKGSVFTHTGGHEMDAAIMCGQSLKAGAVAGVSRIKNPIELAQAVMQNSQHVFLSGGGAEAFAATQNIPVETDDYFFDAYRFKQWQQVKNTGITQLDHADEKKFGTVGCVAFDVNGNLAAATSTGGMTNKQYGRIGDTPIIGAGTYANNNTCAVSCTGHGEYFIRAVVAYDISCLMEYRGLTLQQACDKVVKDKLLQMGGEGGVIAIDKNGQIEMTFNSEGMYRACANDTQSTVAIYS